MKTSLKPLLKFYLIFSNYDITTLCIYKIQYMAKKNIFVRIIHNGLTEN